METRASKKRANAQPPLVIVPKRHRVALGELSDLIVPENNPNEKLQYLKNPNLNNSATTTIQLPDSNLDKPVHTKKNTKHDNQRIIEAYVSDIFDYLRTMEVIHPFLVIILFNIYSFCSNQSVI